MSWLTYWWPGLHGLYRRGKFLSSCTAVSYGLLLSLGVAAAWVWPEILEGRAEQFLWTILFLLAAATFFVGDRIIDEADEPSPESGEKEDPYRTAMSQYLLGDWFRAERTLKNILRQSPRDMECRLLLATLFRHTGRIDEARRELLYISKIEQAWRWDVELQREWASLQEACSEKETAEKDETGNASSSPEELEESATENVESDEGGGPQVYSLDTADRSRLCESI
jgi:hypothetical protein